MKLIIIKIFDNAFEAHILKGKLESEGIESFLFDEYTVSVNPMFNQTIGGIKLKVKSEDYDDTLEIIKSSKSIPITDDDEKLIQCPNCNSNELYSGFKSVKNVKGFFTTLISWLFGVLPFYYDTVYRCKKCDTEFKIN